MADQRDGSRPEDLARAGDVKLGVALQGEERGASLRRGGDGRAARFDGGYLVAGQGPGNPPALSGREATLCVRLFLPAGTTSAPLLGRHDPEDPLGEILSRVRVDRRQLSYEASRKTPQGETIEFAWRTEPLERRVAREYFSGEWCGHLRKAAGPDFLNGVLRVSAPMELIGADRWHDTVVRFRRATPELKGSTISHP
jgi:hypothetical protein